jgi:hypothetical protein
LTKGAKVNANFVHNLNEIPEWWNNGMAGLKIGFLNIPLFRQHRKRALID